MGRLAFSDEGYGVSDFSIDDYSKCNTSTDGELAFHIQGTSSWLFLQKAFHPGQICRTQETVF
jgi:hypothetical protein